MKLLLLCLAIAIVSGGSLPRNKREDTKFDEPKPAEEQEEKLDEKQRRPFFGGAAGNNNGFGGIQSGYQNGYNALIVGSGNQYNPYPGAQVGFSNIGPNGRPALAYEDPCITINLREKQKAEAAAGRKKRADSAIEFGGESTADEGPEEKRRPSHFGGGHRPGNTGYPAGFDCRNAQFNFQNVGPNGRPALQYISPTGTYVDIRKKPQGAEAAPVGRRRKRQAQQSETAQNADDDQKKGHASDEAKPAEEGDEKWIRPNYGGYNSGFGNFGGYNAGFGNYGGYNGIGNYGYNTGSYGGYNAFPARQDFGYGYQVKPTRKPQLNYYDNNGLFAIDIREKDNTDKPVAE